MAKDKKEKKEKKSKKEKKEKKKKEKKEKKSKKDKKDKKQKKDKVRTAKTTTTTTTAATSSSVFNITLDDYFRKGPNFRHWLTQFKQIDFEDLETVQAREYFKEFVQLWNNNQLPTSITAPSSEAIRSVPRTKFAWGIEASTKEQFDLDALHDSVTSATNKRKAGTLGPSGPPRGGKRAHSSTSSGGAFSSNPKRDLILARAKAAEAAEDEKLKQFKKAMGLS